MPDHKADLTKVAPDVAGGIIPGVHEGKHNDTGEVIRRRISLHEGSSTCHRHEVLIPAAATDLLLDLDRLIERYEAQRIPGQRELILLFTVRFAGGQTIHAQFEQARAFAYQRLAKARSLPVVLVQHQPGLAGYATGKPHVHMLAFTRELRDAHFLGFTQLVKETSAKAVLAAEWADWLASNA